MKAVKKKLRTKSLPDRIKKVRKLILSAGNTIGSVHFNKRSGGFRKMAYRLHVNSPSIARKPHSSKNYWKIDRDNLQLTVLDVNVVSKSKEGLKKRTGWRTIPLENVTRICVKGKVYEI